MARSRRTRLGAPDPSQYAARVACLTRTDTRLILHHMVQYSHSIDETLRALADPTRRAVVERLATGSCSVSELAQPFSISLTAMRKHLAVLEGAGVVTTEKRGRVRHCRLAAPEPMTAVASWINQRLMIWEGRFDALARHLAHDGSVVAGEATPDRADGAGGGGKR